MPTYKYQARDERGNAVTGTLPATDPEALADKLRKMGYLVTQTREIADGASIDGFFEKFRRVSFDDMVLFNVQLSKMVQVGIPLVTSLDTLSEQIEQAKLKDVTRDVARNVEGGASFSEALQQHPAIFPGLFIAMVRAGEASGKLDEILRRLADFTKRQSELRHQLQTAMTYPILLLMVGIAVAGFLLMGIIPKFMAIFLEAGVALPLPTQLLYQLSEVLRHYWWLLGAGLVGVWVGLIQYVRTPAGRRQFDTTLLKIPIIGPLVCRTAIARMARTLETLLTSGVAVLESLSIAEQTCGNAVIADAIRNAQTSVRQGGTISDPLKISGQFPPMVVQMLTVGEASGTLDHMLREIAEHFDELIEHGLKRLTTFIEPFFLVLMGGMVAFIMASILLPMFRMVQVVK